jgi:hypothetical protein
MAAYRPNFGNYIQVSLALAREALRRSYDALETPAPDTFSGRKTQEPFPQEDEAARIRSKELQLLKSGPG